MKLLLFLTFGNSLTEWKKNKIYDREILPYLELHKRKISTKIFSYGSQLEDEKIKTDNIDLINISKNKIITNKFILFIKTIFFIKKYSKKFNCDVIKTNQVWGAPFAVFLKFILKKPLVVRAGWEPYLQLSKYKKNYFKLTIFFLNSYFSYKYSNHIIVTSAHIKNFISLRFNINNSKITVINNYINNNLFKKKISHSNRYINKILFVGRLTKQKNIEELIHAISATKYELDIIGEGEDRSKLIKLVKKHNLKVNFLGSVENQILVDYYNRYKLFILPSFVEGNPKSLLEAMACGCAVICSNVDGNNSVIEHGINGYLADTNRSSIKKAIVKIMENEKLQLMLSNNSVKYVKEFCDLHKNLSSELKIYNNLLNE